MTLPLFDDWLIRSLLPSDAEAIVKYANNRRVSITLRDAFPFPYTLKDAKTWIDHARKASPEYAWAIASSRELIGGIGVHPQSDVYRHSAELGYWIGEPYWGRGVVTAAVKAMVDYTFRNSGIVRIFAGVFETNPSSARVLEKAGFALEGRLRKSVLKDNSYLDQFIYAILKEDWHTSGRREPV